MALLVSKMSQAQDKLTLKEITNFTFFGEIGIPFSLKMDFNYKHLCLMTKNETILLENSFSVINHQNCMNVERAKVSVPTFIPTKQIQVDEQAVFDSANHLQKGELMMDQVLLPHCSVPHITSYRAGFSPHDSSNPILMTYISSFGALILYRKVNDEWEEVGNISEVRCTSSNLNFNKVNKFDKLKKSVRNLVFQEFDWCPVIFGNEFRLLVTKLKSEEICIYAIKFNDSMKKVHAEVKFKKENIEHLKNCCLKWLFIDNRHYLVISDENGAILVYKIGINCEGCIESFEKISFVEGISKIPANNLTFEILEDEGFLVIATKTHSVEAFFYDCQGRYLSSVLKYIGLCITGVQNFQKMTYFFSTIDGKIYFLDFLLDNHTLSCGVGIELETGVHLERYAFHGICASRNKAILYVVLYPQQNFDHLVLKQPLAINLFKISSVDPYQVLIDNPTHKLTDYYDCLELVRFLGARDQATLQPLEKLTCKTEISNKFLYFLKIQMVIYNAKFTFFKKRSNLSADSCLESINIISNTIEVVRACLTLRGILAKQVKKPSELPEVVLKSAKCLRNFISLYLKLKLSPERNSYQLKLWSDVERIIEKTSFLKKFHFTEKCVYCEETIEKGELICKNDHRFARCAVTKLQLPIITKRYCKQCKRGAQTDDILKAVTFENAELMTCPICDLNF